MTVMRTRFAPSPTGYIHCGNARAALFNALLATREKGALVLRIEDTDQARSSTEFAAQLEKDLHWLGLTWQEGPDISGQYGPYLQSARHPIYEKYYKILEEKKLIYPCFCSDAELALNRKLQLSRGQPPRYPGTCRALSAEVVAEKIAQGAKPAYRFIVPQNTSIEFVDLVKGPQKFSADDMGDFIIRRADGTAPFLFCNAIDDATMKISHVLRGEDHIANTPRQLMILAALELTPPQYGHLSLITGADGAPLSKRNGSFSLQELQQQGYLPLALANYLARLGHVYASHDLLDFVSLAREFNLEKLSRSPARFDHSQLLHWQKEVVRKLDDAATLAWLQIAVNMTDIPAAKKTLFVKIMRENCLFPRDAQYWLEKLFVEKIVLLNEDAKELLHTAGKNYFVTLKNAIEEHHEDIKKICADMSATLTLSGKKLYQPLRVALTGELDGPELQAIAHLLGKDAMLARVDAVLKELESYKK